MTREEAIAIFKGFKFLPREMKAVEMAIQALKQEPTTKNDLAVDCISKKYALMCVDNHWWNGRDIRIAIEKAPIVYPKNDKPSGKWEQSATFDEHKKPYSMCSNCRSFYLQENVKSYKYCPNCGAKMESEDA